SAALRLCVKKKTGHFGTKMKNLKDSILQNQQLATLILGRSSDDRPILDVRKAGCTRMHSNARLKTKSRFPSARLRKPSQGYASQNIVGGWRTRINSLSASNGGRVGVRCRCCNLALDPALNAFPTPSTRYDTLGHGEFISRSGDGRG